MASRTGRTIAFVGDAESCARVFRHLGARGTAMRHFEPHAAALHVLRDAARAGAIESVVAVLPDPAAVDRLCEILGTLDICLYAYATPLDAPRPHVVRGPSRILPVALVSGRALPFWGRVLKSGTDRVLAALLLLGLAPLLVLIALAVRVDSRGPILFRQWRDGRNGVPFEMLKFRTMRWPPGPFRQAVRQDSRVTRIGALLRRTSLDELPQLVNILRGEMSLVGPRPHVVAMRLGDLAARELLPGYERRHRVKPGMTGLAQITGRRGGLASVEDLRERLRLDLDYIERWSPLLDLRLILLTPLHLVFHKGTAF